MLLRSCQPFQQRIQTPSQSLFNSFLFFYLVVVVIACHRSYFIAFLPVVTALSSTHARSGFCSQSNIKQFQMGLHQRAQIGRPYHVLSMPIDYSNQVAYNRHRWIWGKFSKQAINGARHHARLLLSTYPDVFLNLLGSITHWKHRWVNEVAIQNTNNKVSHGFWNCLPCFT